jgi:hypothetical protein
VSLKHLPLLTRLPCAALRALQYPRCLPYTGHITVGGSVCIQALTLSGGEGAWQPSYSVESIMNVRSCREGQGPRMGLGAATCRVVCAWTLHGSHAGHADWPLRHMQWMCAWGLIACWTPTATTPGTQIVICNAIDCEVKIVNTPGGQQRVSVGRELHCI